MCLFLRESAFISTYEPENAAKDVVELLNQINRIEKDLEALNIQYLPVGQDRMNAFTPEHVSEVRILRIILYPNQIPDESD